MTRKITTIATIFKTVFQAVCITTDRGNPLVIRLEIINEIDSLNIVKICFNHCSAAPIC